jgi:hypothetical protein
MRAKPEGWMATINWVDRRNHGTERELEIDIMSGRMGHSAMELQ